MYFIMCFGKELLIWKSVLSFGVFDLYVLIYCCWLWDLDLWIELNNGCILMFYDLGCIFMVVCMGVIGVLCENGWGIIVVGNLVCYCCRIWGFDCFIMILCNIGWDVCFLYME